MGGGEKKKWEGEGTLANEAINIDALLRPP